MYNGFNKISDSKSDISYPRKKIKKHNEAGTVKLSYNKNVKNYHYLQKAYGIQAMPFKSADTKHTHRETMLQQNKGHMVYVVNFPDQHISSTQKPVKAGK